jgi:hypothetical protein
LQPIIAIFLSNQQLLNVVLAALMLFKMGVFSIIWVLNPADLTMSSIVRPFARQGFVLGIVR